MRQIMEGVKIQSTPGKCRRPAVDAQKHKILDFAYDPKEINDLTKNALGSGKQYNNITTLLQIVKSRNESATKCCSALCRIFSTLILQGRLESHANLSKNEIAVVIWLTARYKEFGDILCCYLTENDITRGELALKYALELVRVEWDANPDLVRHLAPGTLFSNLMHLIFSEAPELVFEALVEAVVAPLSSVKFLCGKTLFAFVQSKTIEKSPSIDRSLTLLSALSTRATEDEPILGSSKPLEDDTASGKRLSGDEIGRCWLDFLKFRLTKPQRLRVLEMMPSRIAPLVPRPELLLDFLTECCDRGGTETLASLLGLRHLISEHNLDYPEVYTRLYCAIDSNSLHKKYRSQTIRLLQSYLSSTHISAAITASFIKKLARLCLYAPPSAIVAILPLIYNLIQTNRACGVMIHRAHTSTLQSSIENRQLNDIFDAAEREPSRARAIDSSLWELDSLAFHWHPNVATISRIIAEQFLKHSYNLEDFLDHSYGSLLRTEVRKLVIKQPVVEYQVSKVIFTESIDQHDRQVLNSWSFDNGKMA